MPTLIASITKRRIALVLALLTLALSAVLAAYYLNLAGFQAGIDRYYRWYSEKYAAPPYAFDRADLQAITQAKARVPLIRRGRTTLRLTGLPSDSPLPLQLRWEQSELGFRIGTAEKPHPGLDRVARRLRATQRTLMSMWNTEVTRTTPDPDRRKIESEQALAHYRAAGYSTLYHTGIWLIQDKKDQAEPEIWIPSRYFPGSSFHQQRQWVLDRAADVARYSDGRFEVVNLWNEPVNKWAMGYGWSLPQQLSVVKEAALRFKSINKTSRLMLNFAEPQVSSTRPMEFTEFLEWVHREQVPIDIHGIQIWTNGLFPWKGAMRQSRIAHLDRLFKDWGRFQVPLDVTEFSAPAAGSPYGGRLWTERRQADFAEAFLWICLGAREIEGLTFFSIKDRFMLDSGFVAPDGRPREVVNRLERVLESLRTKGSASLNPGADLTVDGYEGVYRLTLQPSGHVCQFTIEKSKQRSETCTFRPADPPLPELYQGLAPRMTRDLVLNGGVSPARTHTRGTPLRMTTGRLTKGTGEPDNVKFPSPQHAAIQLPIGVVRLQGLPPAASRVQVSVEVSQHPAGLQVFAGPRRLIVPPMQPGKYLLWFDSTGTEPATIFPYEDTLAPRGTVVHLTDPQSTPMPGKVP